ncbi:uncharacterized protein [Nicotiana tomentosiformis]|uniref:uncharacterized protein n=1 Tax=Nicotiana tomentosiformis TaxID=4098 RepID=UPI00051AD020|nr:serine/threonine-protein kinase rio2-like [Nicotiana tomentosiformis]
MPKSSQTPSKSKLSSKAEAKSKIMKPKSKKSAKLSSEPILTPAPSPSISSTVPASSSYVPAALTIPTSTASPLPKPTTHAPEPTAKNTSKSIKFKATPRKSVKKVPDAVTKVDTVVKESVVQGESVPVIANQVQNPHSKLDVLVSNIYVAPLDSLPSTSEKPKVEEFTVENGVCDMGKEVDTTTVGPVVEGERSKEPMQKEASDSLSFSWTENEDDDGVNEEENSENKGASGDEKESDTDDKIGKQVNDSAEEENHSEVEDNSESEGEDQEKVSESEGVDEESEEENKNLSEKSEGFMPNGNTVIAPSEETGEEKRTQKPRSLLTPFTGDEEVRSAKKPRKKVSIVEPMVELDGEDESESASLTKSSTPKRKVAKVTKTAMPSARTSRENTRKNVPAAVDRLTEFRNR